MLPNLSETGILIQAPGKGRWGLEIGQTPPQGRGSVVTHGGARGGFTKIFMGDCTSTEPSAASELEL